MVLVNAIVKTLFLEILHDSFIYRPSRSSKFDSLNMNDIARKKNVV